MEMRKELQELSELLASKRYTNLRQYLTEQNEADIAGLMEELEGEDMLKVFRLSGVRQPGGHHHLPVRQGGRQRHR